VAAGTVERRLAAIMFTDIVGYTALMAESEEKGLRVRQRHRQVVRPLVEQYHGESIEARGDESLSVFPSALDAVNCALPIQAELSDDPELKLHLGIHLGDLVVQGGEVSGDGVNIASRICSISEGGGLCVSGEVYRSIRNQPDIEALSLGERQLKNVGQPVAVYLLGKPGTLTATQSVQPCARPRALLVAGVVVLLVVGGLLVWRLPTTTPSITPSDDQFTVPGFGDVPAIAVLAFDNLSRDADQEYFADGIAEDLMTRLSRSRRLPVIARNSSFTYKGQAVDVQRIGRELGARYVVEGSVRKAGERVRISAQLIDTATGHHLWAETYDRELRDVFALQDEIATAIAAATGAKLVATEQERAARQQSPNATAYDLMLRGWWYHDRSWLEGPEEASEARALFERAIELEPELASAHVGIARTHIADWYFVRERRRVSLGEAERAARRSIALDPELPDAHLVLAWVHQIRGERHEMLAAAHRAIELDPSYSRAYRDLGFYLAESGQPDEALRVVETGMRLSPRDPELPEFLRAGSRAHFAAGRYRAAAEWAMRSIQEGPMSFFSWLDLAASQAQLGLLEEARAALLQAQEARSARGPLTLAELTETTSYVDAAFNERWFDGLRKAGLKE
jgi:adenylate cyclase